MSIWSSIDCHKQTDNMNRTEPNRAQLKHCVIILHISWYIFFIWFLSLHSNATSTYFSLVSPSRYGVYIETETKKNLNSFLNVLKWFQKFDGKRIGPIKTDTMKSKKERKKITRHTPKWIQVGKKNPCMHQLNITCVWRLGHTKNSWTLFLCLF